MNARLSHLGELLPATTTAAHTARAAKPHTTTGGASFADTLTQATEKTDKTDKARSEIKLRKDETLSPVDGRAFAELEGGRRDGLYMNTSGNARHGQTFTMAIRHGRELHIYGTGHDRVVVSVPVRKATDDDATKTTGGTSPTVSAS